MKTTVQNPTDTRVKLTIELGSEELVAAEQVALTKLAREVKAPGFRKGNVPLSVAKKHIDQQMLSQQTLEDALSKAVAEAFIEKDIQVLERPNVEVKKYVPGQEVEFTAEAERIPEVKLGDYKKFDAKRTVKKVPAEEIDNVIERIAAGLSEKKEAKRVAKLGDEAIIDFVGRKGDEAFEGGTATDYALELGSNSFIPGFEEAIVGHKASEKSFDVALEFPKDYNSKDLAGQKVVFTTTLKKVNEVVKPDVDDTFAAKAGPFKTLKELKDDIKRELSAQKEKEADNKLKDTLVEQLVEASNIPTPDILVEDQVRSIEQDMTQNLTYQGMTLEQYLQAQGFVDKDAWLEQEVKPAATKRVQAGLALSKLSKLESIEASSEDLAAQLTQYRQQYANDPDMAKRFDEPEIQREVANRLITEKTVDRLVELNTKKSTKK